MSVAGRIDPADLSAIVNQEPGLWEPLRGQRIFITGGTGFVGRWLLESFIQANNRLNLGAEATVLSRHPEKFTESARHLAGHPAIRLAQGDVRSFTFPPEDFSYVIHAAAESGSQQGTDEPLEMFDTLTQGTRRVLEFSSSHAARRFLYVSSGAVYGLQPAGVTGLSEDFSGAPDPLDSHSAYGEGKRVAEMLCALASRGGGFEFQVARGFAFVGPYLPLDGHFAIGNFIRDALAGGPLRVQGDGTPIRSYLYSADLALWLWTILLRGENGRAYNVGSDEAISIADLAYRVRDLLAPSAEVRVAQKPIPGALPQRYVPDVGRAKNELGLKINVSLDEAISRTVAFCRADNASTSRR
jgi:dTDP-glucose 4,6-dehydratase